MKLRLFLLLSFAITTMNAEAKTDESRWCGTQRDTVQTEYLLKKHERHKRQVPVQARSISHLSTDVGEIAVIEGSPSTIVEPNSFDLRSKKIFFDELGPSNYR